MNDEKEIRFEDCEPVVLPARWAVPVLLMFPDEIEVISSVKPGLGCEILFENEAGEVLRGMALWTLTCEGASWFLLRVGEAGRLVPTERIVGVNPAPLFRFVGQAVNAIGTPEAKAMGVGMVMTFLRLDPEE
uniref:hypothetical protein n=1 Tax=Nitrospira cf. moscoviensis SBR1015 TaxID=96242 RepID=UPI001121AC14|nr:hypothetical protein [Nitrospira cf. moscoviensis SBR1015]